MNALSDRRTMLRRLGVLTAGAAASAVAIPAIAAAAEPDPVFRLLEAHKAAWARLLETYYLPTLLKSSILRSPLLADKPCGTGIAPA
jgi:hypothetical protein